MVRGRSWARVPLVAPAYSFKESLKTCIFHFFCILRLLTSPRGDFKMEIDWRAKFHIIPPIPHSISNFCFVCLDLSKNLSKSSIMLYGLLRLRVKNTCIIPSVWLFRWRHFLLFLDSWFSNDSSEHAHNSNILLLWQKLQYLEKILQPEQTQKNLKKL